MATKRFPIEWVVVAIPVAVALLHLVMMAQSSQTRWKGGGFGMYADPHPNSYRAVWLVGEDAGGNEAAFSLEPFEDRVRYGEIEAVSRRRALGVLHEVAEEGKNFPELMDIDAIAFQLRQLRATPAGDEEVERLLRILPETDVRLRVMEVRINESYSALEAKPIYEVALP